MYYVSLKMQPLHYQLNYLIQSKTAHIQYKIFRRMIWTFLTSGYSQEVSKGLKVLHNAVKLVITNRYVEAEAMLRDK